MILLLKKWCEEIIISIVICLIFEMIVPEGNNKKYINVIIGIYIVFVVINPLLSLKDLDIDIFEEKNDISTSVVDVNDEIKNVYVIGIKESIKNEIRNLGYDVSLVEIEFDDNYENIKNVKVKIIGENINYESIIEIVKNNYFVEEIIFL